jgi:hypothetical protein
MFFGIGVNGEQPKGRGKGEAKKDEKTHAKPQPVKSPKAPAKEAIKPPVQQKVDTPEVAAMPPDTGLITNSVTADTTREEPTEVVIWKDPEEAFAWLPWLSLFVAVGMGVYVVWANSDLRGRLRKIEKHLSKQFLGIGQDKPKPGISSAEVENLITSSPALKKIQEECNTIKGMVEKMQPVAKVIPISNIPVAPVEEGAGGTFYMTGPTSNYFPANARSNQKENTVYKFVLQPGGNEAKFELHTMGASVSEIIKVIESYIKPACDEENLPNAGTRNIVTKKPGVAILENDKWVIKYKAIIKYE